MIEPRATAELHTGPSEADPAVAGGGRYLRKWLTFHHYGGYTSTMTQTAADLFITSAAEIVTRTGCTVDQALSFLVNKMADERPELLVKVILTAPVAA